MLYVIVAKSTDHIRKHQPCRHRISGDLTGFIDQGEAPTAVRRHQQFGVAAGDGGAGELQVALAFDVAVGHAEDAVDAVRIGSGMMGLLAVNACSGRIVHVVVVGPPDGVLAIIGQHQQSGRLRHRRELVGQ